MPGQSQCSPMPPLQEVRRGGASGTAEFARSRRSGCVPGAACRHQQSATGQERCAGDTSLAVRAVDGISLLQGIEVSAPSPSHPGGFELRTVVVHVHAHVWQRAWPTHAVEPAGCVAPVGSIQETSPFSTEVRDFFLRSRPPRRHKAKHYCAVTLPLSPRGSEVDEID
jgi:hypothetical protein